MTEQTSDPTNEGIGEPLPVGAHDPENAEPAPAPRPPGLLREVSDLDYEMADKAHARWNVRRPSRDRVRPDQATLRDARAGLVESDIHPFKPREALLRLVSELRKREDRHLDEYAQAVRMIEESRDAYRIVLDHRDSAIAALDALGLLTDEDRDEPEPEAPAPTIPDDLIV